MSESIQVAILASTAALLGSIITGVITYLTAVKQQEAEKYKRRLEVALKDIIAFYRLEEEYTRALSTPAQSAEAIKREFRRMLRLRVNGQDSPSQFATITESQRRLQDL